MLESGVKEEDIIVCHVSPFRLLTQDPLLGTCKRLQRHLQLLVFDPRRSEYVRVRELITIIEEKKHNRLQQGDDKLLAPQRELGSKSAMA